jgi:hypothetical protein
MDVNDVDNFGSVAWDTNPDISHQLPASDVNLSSPPLTTTTDPYESTSAAPQNSSSGHQFVNEVMVKDPIKELEGTKDMFVSYFVEAKVRSHRLDYY